MIIISKEPLYNGAHANEQEFNSALTIPDGFIVVPEEFIPIWEQYKPFVAIAIENNIIVAMTDNSQAREASISIGDVRNEKIIEISSATQEAIVNGIDVTTSYGIEHFGLNDHDQTNITNLFLLTSAGKTSLPYHADGKPCVKYIASDIIKIYEAALQHITYCTSYYNFLKQWINRETNINIINNIQFGDELPQDLSDALNAVINID